MAESVVEATVTFTRPDRRGAVIGWSAALISAAAFGTSGAFAKPLLVVPRASRFGEHVNDHQVATARKFESLGHVMVAYDVSEVASKVAGLAGFVPRPRVADRERMARRIGLLIDEMQSARRRE